MTVQSQHFHWITPSQMLDGLALGETTPGPLIIVITYVGFIGGYVKSFLGPRGAMVEWSVGGYRGHVVYFFALLYFYFSRWPSD
jgi:chromate transporter